MRTYRSEKKSRYVAKPVGNVHNIKSKWINRPTFLFTDRPVTGNYQTQRSYHSSIHPAGRSSHSSSLFCIPVTNRFESLSVAEEQTTNMQVENIDNKVHTPRYLHSKNESSEFESTNLIECQSFKTSETGISNNSVKVFSNTSTRCRKVKKDHKQPVHVRNNSELLSQNSTPKIIQSADQKPDENVPQKLFARGQI